MRTRHEGGHRDRLLPENNSGRSNRKKGDPFSLCFVAADAAAAASELLLVSHRMRMEDGSERAQRSISDQNQPTIRARRPPMPIPLLAMPIEHRTNFGEVIHEGEEGADGQTQRQSGIWL